MSEPVSQGNGWTKQEIAIGSPIQGVELCTLDAGASMEISSQFNYGYTILLVEGDDVTVEIGDSQAYILECGQTYHVTVRSSVEIQAKRGAMFMLFKTKDEDDE